MTTFIYTKDTGVLLNLMKKSMAWKNNKKQPKIEMPLNWMEIELYENFPCSKFLIAGRPSCTNGQLVSLIHTIPTTWPWLKSCSK